MIIIQCERALHYRMLRVLVDEKLIFNQHINFLGTEISKIIIFLNKPDNFRDNRTLLLICYTFVHPNCFMVE